MIKKFGDFSINEYQENEPELWPIDWDRITKYKAGVPRGSYVGIESFEEMEVLKKGMADIAILKKQLFDRTNELYSDLNIPDDELDYGWSLAVKKYGEFARLFEIEGEREFLEKYEGTLDNIIEDFEIAQMRKARRSDKTFDL